MCPTCGGGLWPGREKTTCVDKFHLWNQSNEIHQPTPTLTPEECKARCNDGGYERCCSVPCPCGCGGRLRSDGRNTMETLTFLQCTVCKCTFVAEDE